MQFNISYVFLGPGTLLTKIDIKSAFRVLSVHPADRHLLGMKWNNEVYLDSCLLFGLRLAPRLFNVLADLLEWILHILHQQGVTFSLHYLDDFLTIGLPGSDIIMSPKFVHNSTGLSLARYTPSTLKGGRFIHHLRFSEWKLVFQEKYCREHVHYLRAGC